MLQTLAPTMDSTMRKITGYGKDVIYPESQRDWAELIEYPFRTLNELEGEIEAADEQVEHLMEVARIFRDKANIELVGEPVVKGTKVKGEHISPYYIAYSFDRSYNILKWRNHRTDSEGNLLNNRRRAQLSEEMLLQCPEKLREKMLKFERRRIELNYVAGVIAFKRARLKMVLEQIRSINALKSHISSL
jgi:hypothetical protein